MLIAVSCVNQHKQLLEEKVAETDRMCPIQCGAGVSIDSVKYDHNTVDYWCGVSSSVIRLDLLTDRQEEVRQALAAMVEQSDNPKIREDLQLCAKADAKVRFILDDGTEQLQIEIDPKNMGININE